MAWSHAIPFDFVLQTEDQQFQAANSHGGPTPVGTTYWWPTEQNPWNEQQTLTAAVTPMEDNGEPLSKRLNIPPTLHLENFPDSHQETPFNIDLKFSQAISTTVENLKNETIQLTGAEITEVKNIHGQRVRWSVNIKPTSTQDVTIRVTPTEECGTTSSLCNHEETPVHNSASITIPGPPMTARFEETPNSHDGSSDFTFHIRFSEEPKLNGSDVKDNVLTVTSGEVTGARQTNPQGNSPNSTWGITIAPDGNSDVTIVLTPTTNCNDGGAVCTDGGKKLTSTSSITVVGPTVTNSPASGQPTINGTAQSGQTLNADTSSITDANGMTKATSAYQWIRGDADISGATGSSYTLTNADAGNHIKVKVTFTDDDGFAESLTSASRNVQAPAPLTAMFDASTVPASHDGSSPFTLEVYFSEEPTLSFIKVRDYVFNIANGDITKVRRTDPNGQEPNLRWKITVEPTGTADVTFTLPPRQTATPTALSAPRTARSCPIRSASRCLGHSPPADEQAIKRQNGGIFKIYQNQRGCCSQAAPPEESIPQPEPTPEASVNKDAHGR